MPLRVLISHSSKTAQEKAFLAKLDAALRGDPALEVLLDDVDITPGDVWYETLVSWLAYCDAAVLLVTPSVAKSAYTPHEISVLANRFWAERAGAERLGRAPMLLLPVIRDVDPSTIATIGPIEARRIMQVQGVKPTATDDEAIEWVRTKLTEHALARRLSVDRRIVRLAECLMNVPEPVLAGRIYNDWNVAAKPWMQSVGARELAAMHLLHAGFERACRCLDLVRTSLDAPSAPARPQLEAALWLIASGWIPRPTCAVVEALLAPTDEPALSPSPSRHIVFRAAKQETVCLAVVGATRRAINDPEKVAHILSARSGSVDDLLTAIRAALTEKLKPGELSLEEALAEMPCATVVCLPAGVPVDTAVMSRLAAELPNVRFVLMHPLPGAADTTVTPPDRVTDEFDPAQETAWHTQYEKKRWAIVMRPTGT